MRMTFEEYDDKIAKMKKIKNPSLTEDYGVTREDLDRIKKEPEKYIEYLLYLSTRPWYDINDKESSKKFANSDALICTIAAEEIDEILYESLELVD